MSDFFTTNLVKARKRHRCDLCWTPIDKNEYYVRGFGVNDGSGYTQKCHRICQSIINHLMKRHFDDGIDFTTHASEYVEYWLALRHRELREDISDDEKTFGAECDYFWKPLLSPEDIEACVNHCFEWCKDNKYSG
jgi:hypothetical protein